jgi:hypothetical protein
LQLERFPLRRGGKMIEKDKASSHTQEMHYAMFLGGWKECAILGEFCKWWESDFSDFSANKNIADLDQSAVQLMLDEYKQED